MCFRVCRKKISVNCYRKSYNSFHVAQTHKTIASSCFKKQVRDISINGKLMYDIDLRADEGAFKNVMSKCLMHHDTVIQTLNIINIYFFK